jgi:hypothetical protein
MGGPLGEWRASARGGSDVLSNSRSTRPSEPEDILVALRSLDGQRIEVDCPFCQAFEVIWVHSHDHFELAIYHEDSCPALPDLSGSVSVSCDATALGSLATNLGHLFERKTD